jgi:hypothetical protein
VVTLGRAETAAGGNPTARRSPPSEFTPPLPLQIIFASIQSLELAAGNGSISTILPTAPGATASGRNGSIKRTLAPIEYNMSNTMAEKQKRRRPNQLFAASRPRSLCSCTAT